MNALMQMLKTEERVIGSNYPTVVKLKARKRWGSYRQSYKCGDVMAQRILNGLSAGKTWWQLQEEFPAASLYTIKKIQADHEQELYGVVGPTQTKKLGGRRRGSGRKAFLVKPVFATGFVEAAELDLLTRIAKKTKKSRSACLRAAISLYNSMYKDWVEE